MHHAFDQALGHPLNRLAVVVPQVGEFFTEGVLESAVGNLLEAPVDALGCRRKRPVEKMTSKGLDLVVHELLAAVHLGQPQLAIVFGLSAHLLDSVDFDATDGPRVGIEIGRHGEIDEKQLFVGVELRPEELHVFAAQHDLVR